MNLKRFLNMSTKLSYDEAMGISNTNSHSQFTHCLSQKHIKLMPKYLGNVKSGVVQQLDSEVFVYSKELGGVPVAYSNIRLVQSMGRIMADQTCIHFDILADFVLFKPQIGCTLSGMVNKVGRQHLGCLVHGKFNAWIPWCDPESQSDDLIGLEIEFTVTNIFTNNNILSMKGILIEESLQSAKKNKRKNSHSNVKTIDIPAFDSQMPTPSQFENGPNLCSTRIEENLPELRKRKKAKRDKKSLGDSLSETITESIGDELNAKKPKKKKRKKHISGDSLSETVTESPVGEITSGTSEKKKHKKNKESAGNTIHENTPEKATSEITSDVHVKKKKKKNSLGGSYSETVTEATVSESLLPETKKKKKKKHKLDRSLNETFDERSFKEPQQERRMDDSVKNSLYDAQLEKILVEKLSDIPVKKKKRKKLSTADAELETANETSQRTNNDLSSHKLNSTGYNTSSSNSKVSKHEKDDVSCDITEKTKHSDKHASHESDEGYHSKKAKKKHKRRLKEKEY